MSKRLYFGVVVTSCNDRAHSYSSLHYKGLAIDVDLVFSQEPFTLQYADGVRLVGVAAGIMALPALLCLWTSTIDADGVTLDDGRRRLATIARRSLQSAGYQVIDEGDHIHIELDVKRPAIWNPKQLRETVRQAIGADAELELVERITAALVALRHK